ncbi:ABC transporter-like,P-loop containing nucleoside triphosphate hydrolase,ABC transporter [Cinara cedri]|uniref:ABC transporter-like,P-loop containing nucleoside triphosphate hydrolase,ABC transporter n=1 Tax=Cinara cedri TaxID=506608 RepID=A0A5E4NAD3_9HEMI|nr:ABC transporter-like,P-loop containing nucleoside triphosphate hydrolase,ABC transporter [Cinara cedri]
MESIDLEFNNLSLTVNIWEPLVTKTLRPDKKTILKNVSGSFYRNQVTAILGCSGSGKSTLMNILSGYTSSGYQGSVTLNGARRDLLSFRNVSSYIMQEDHLQLYLTVQESMEIAMKLKHSTIKLDMKKRTTINSLLDNLLLCDKRDSLVYTLSGGERRRLTIALELVRSPQVMFFDEPTTGLDIVSANKVIKIMRKLADSGKTIICTIHQASAYHLTTFDTVYVLTPFGQCMYNGKSSQIVNYFSDLGFQCPIYHNPADYVIELSLGEYENSIDTLVNLVEEQNQNDQHIPNQSGQSDDNEPVVYNREYSTKYFPELWILMHRSLLTTLRDHFLVNVRLFVHFVLGTMFGIVYMGLGKSAMHVRDNAVLLFFCVMFMTYVASFTMSLKFPLELSVMRKEYFNRWYSLSSYYISITLVDLPVQIFCTFLFCSLIYLLSGQPIIFFRISMFLLIFIVTGLMSQAIGMLVSTLCKSFVINTVIVALILMFWTTYSGGMIRISDTPEIYRWLYDISFMKHSVQGVLHAVYGFDRSVLPCSNIFCPYGSPKVMLKTIDMADNLYWINVSFITSIYFVLKISSFIALKYKLSTT